MPDTGQTIVARSRAFSDIMALAKRVAPSSCSVLITGESGTGKELIARAIHDASAACAGQYIPVNVAAMPADLVESQLFGHVHGAFTGAAEDRLGAFRAASGGTLLLDEIGDLPLATQPKLLRALEEQQVIPVGADTPVPIDTRVIAATSRNLDAMIDNGGFRADLLYRLNAFQISIPPLRERPEDIPVLAGYYCERFCQQLQKPPKTISKDAMQRLMNHSWNGNVRELAHTLEHAVLLCEGQTISANDLPDSLNQCMTITETNLGDAVEAFKRRHIISTLEAVDGDRKQAAEQLGLSPATLFRYIDRYGLKGYALDRHARQRHSQN